ncbi:MAG: tail fiber protein [Candidatus Korobacteraceae bacterium]|jgi:microcystin-dependent protein
MAEPFVGEIRIFGGNFAPVGWALCNGSLLQISQYTALFSLLGTMYGGDGIRTFALPDLRGRVVVSFGQGPGLSPYVQGQVGGAESSTLTTAQMPSHSHAVGATETPTTADPKGAVPAKNVGATPGSGIHTYGATPDGTTMNNAMIGATGGGQPVSVVQPYLAINYIIALQGIFPSRG